MKIAELFYSLQGEGMLAGVPSVFIRTSGCNLRCTWCDTPYTSWQPEGEDQQVDQIVSAASSYPASHVVVTGGEPMIAPQIVELTERLRLAGLHITIETAGTVFAEVTCDLMSISPKLSNSTPRDRENGKWATRHDRLRLQLDVLRKLMSHYVYQLKFVIASPPDVDEVEQLCRQLNAPAEHIILMPEGTDREIVRERGLWLAELCKIRNYRYSPRLHIDLWGDRRGI